MNYVILYGNPEDGFEAVGPFVSYDDARTHAESAMATEWTVIELSASDTPSLA